MFKELLKLLTKDLFESFGLESTTRISFGFTSSRLIASRTLFKELEKLFEGIITLIGTNLLMRKYRKYITT